MSLTLHATSPARVGGSPLRHSPLARPVPPLPHAGEANVTYRFLPPTFTGEVARRAGEGQLPHMKELQKGAGLSARPGKLGLHTQLVLFWCGKLQT